MITNCLFQTLSSLRCGGFQKTIGNLFVSGWGKFDFLILFFCDTVTLER